MGNIIIHFLLRCKINLQLQITSICVGCNLHKAPVHFFFYNHQLANSYRNQTKWSTNSLFCRYLLEQPFRSFFHKFSNSYLRPPFPKILPHQFLLLKYTLHPNTYLTISINVFFLFNVAISYKDLQLPLFLGHFLF